MRGCFVALLSLFCFSASSRAEAPLAAPPPPALPAGSAPRAAAVETVIARPAEESPPPVQYVAPRPAAGPTSPSAASQSAVQYVAPRPAEVPVAPPPPSLPAVQVRKAPAAAGGPAAPPAPAVSVPARPANAGEPISDDALQISEASPASGATAGPAAAATEAGKEAKPPAAELTRDEENAVRGEVSSVGVARMVSRTNRVIVSAGYNRIGKGHYALIHPQVGVAKGGFSLGVGVPLNLEVFNAAYPKEAQPGENHVIGFGNAGSVRREDWDELSEYARVLTFLTYGKKEEPIYLDVGQRHTSTLGHGPIMRRYSSNIDVTLTRVGAQFDAHTDAVGFEAMTNDIMRWNIVGGLAFVRPLALFGADGQLGRFISIGISGAIDREAPARLVMMPEPACPVPGACRAANVPKVDSLNRLEAEREAVALGGIDVELDLVRTKNASIKPYVDYSKLMYRGAEGEGGAGLTVGALGRFGGGKELKHKLRLIAEYRRIGEGYSPGYFDGFYEVDKFLVGGSGGVVSGSGEVPLTKLQATVGEGRLPQRHGYYFEASYGIEDAIAFTLALEGQSQDPAKNFVAHLEVPALSFLQFFASFYKRGFTDYGTLFDLDQKAVAFSGARLKLLPILFLSGRAFKTFELDAFQGSDGPLGTLQYANAFGWAADLEVGFEF